MFEPRLSTHELMSEDRLSLSLSFTTPRPLPARNTTPRPSGGKGKAIDCVFRVSVPSIASLKVDDAHEPRPLPAAIGGARETTVLRRGGNSDAIRKAMITRTCDENRERYKYCTSTVFQY